MGTKNNVLCNLSILRKVIFTSYQWICCQIFNSLLLLSSNQPPQGSEPVPGSSWLQQRHLRPTLGRTAGPSQQERRHTATPGGAQTKTDPVATSRFRVLQSVLLSFRTQAFAQRESKRTVEDKHASRVKFNCRQLTALLTARTDSF